MTARAALLVAVAAACASRGAPGERDLPVLFEGLVEARKRDLRFAARRELADFQTRGRRDADLEDAAYAMELHLREAGFAHAQVRFRREPERAVFEVEEGPRATLESVAFPGATAFAEPELRARFDLRRRAGPFSRKARFRMSAIEGGVADVERMYLLAGYHRVAVGPPRVAWSEDRARASVEIPVQEGARYTVGQVTLEGAPGEEVERMAKAELVGAPYHVRLPFEVAARVRGRLLDEGRLRAEVSARAEIDDAASTARVVLRVVPGPIYRLRELAFTGADRTRPRFLRSRVPLESGDALRQDRIDAAIDELYATGAFKSVRAVPHDFVDRGDEGDAALRLEVEELLARSVSFEAGWGSYELARGRVRYENRNLLGLGRQLGLDLFGSVRGFGTSGSVSDSYLLGRANRLRLGSGFEQREEPSFTRTRTSFDLSVERRFEGPYTAVASYLLESQKATDVTGAVPGAEEGGFVTSAGLGLSLVRDTRDDRLLPSRGAVAEAGVFWSSPSLGADLEFLELRAAWTRHVPLSDRVVLAAGFRFASREILDDRPTLPITQRLFLGGDSSVRSFAQDELGPVGVNGDPVGGLTAAEAHLEARVRVWRRLHAALFYDVGTLGAESVDLPGPPGHAVGFGLRYHLPVGPVRLDVGYNPGRLFAADGRVAVHFGFGFAF
ncbi:MAG: BamA/OMP85 family outer membrane protein [Planctomycetota bacterium]